MLKFDDNLKEANFSKVIGTTAEVTLPDGRVVPVIVCSGLSNNENIKYTYSEDDKYTYPDEGRSR